MKIKKCKFIKHVAPNMSCGTGYSEYDVFLIRLEDGRMKKVNVNMWYMSKDELKVTVREALEQQLRFDMGDYIDKIMVDNIDEVYEMMYRNKKINNLTLNF